MWVRFYQDIGIGAKLYQQPQNALHIAALVASGIQFAVAVGAGAAFTKTIIALRVDDAFFVELCQVAPPCPYILTSFQQHRPDASFDQSQCGKQTRGPRADNDYLP